MSVYRVVERGSTVLVLYKTSFIGAVNATVSFSQVVSAKLTIYIPLSTRSWQIILYRSSSSVCGWAQSLGLRLSLE